MRCDSVQERLTSYLAGECPPLEAAAISEHLNSCRACACARDQFLRLDSLLDLWPEEAAPEVKEQVLTAIAGAASGQRHLLRKRPWPKLSIKPVYLNLAAAMLISLVFCWFAPAPSQRALDSAGRDMNQAVIGSLNTAGNWLERAALTASYPMKILNKEWDR